MLLPLKLNQRRYDNLAWSAAFGEGRRVASLVCFTADVGRLHQWGASLLVYGLLWSFPAQFLIT